jgi:hypothetical protein
MAAVGTKAIGRDEEGRSRARLQGVGGYGGALGHSPTSLLLLLLLLPTLFLRKTPKEEEEEERRRRA